MTRGPIEQWLTPVELSRSGETRLVADLSDPQTVAIMTQQMNDGVWSEVSRVSLSRAAVERLTVAVSFR